MTETYATLLSEHCADRGSLLCAGIDPSPATMARTVVRVPADRFEALCAWCETVIDAARGDAVAVKLQMAWFEHAGVDGMRALGRVAAFARSAGLVVILDAKRGDIATSAVAYVEAWLGPDATSGMPMDALTVNAWVGLSALTAMHAASPEGTGLYALVHTSNPDAGVLQDAAVSPDGAPWWHLMAHHVAATGCGAVVGATHPGQLAAARELMPTAPLLVPGVGRQGGQIADLAPLATPDAAPVLVTVSGGLLPDQTGSLDDLATHVRTRCAALRTEIAATLG